MLTLDESFAKAQGGAQQPSLDESFAKAQGEYTEPQTSPVTVPESSFQPSGAERPKETPGFIKSAEMIGSGAMAGSLEFTGRLLSYVEKHSTGTSYVKDAVNYWKEKNTEDATKYAGAGILQGAGKLPAEVLTTAPLGGVLGRVGQAAMRAGELMPTGLKTAFKYGTSGVGGAEVLSGMEGLRSGKDMGDVPFSTEQAAKALKSPASYMFPMAGTKVETWANAARGLGQAKEIDPNALARNLLESPATRNMSNMFFGAVPALTGAGKQVRQLSQIGDAASGLVQKLAGTKEALTTDKLTEYSANIMQSTLKKMSRAEDKMWDKPFKASSISDPQAVKDEVINAIDLLKTNRIPGYEASVNSLTNGIRKGNLTVDDVKQLNSRLSSASINARSLEGGVGNELADQLKGVKENLLDHIQNSLSSEAMKDFSAARQFSANKFDLFDRAPLLEKAIYDETSAHKLIGTLVSEGGVLPPKRAALSVLSKGGRDMVGATKIQKALEQSDPANTGKINLDTFLAQTSPYTQTGEILNKEAYKSLEGLNKYLKNVNEASKVGWWRQAAIGSAVAGASGLGAAVAGPMALLPLASYAAMNFAANHSPLKTIFHGLTKELPKSTFDYLIKAADKHITRAGYLRSVDGTLQHKDEKDMENN